MHDFWTWATNHWWLGFWLAFWTLVAVYGAFAAVLSLLNAVLFRLPNRALRHASVRKQGWPPAHLDADGDFKPEPKADQP